MQHTSVPIGAPIEVVKIDPLKQSPLISKCIIKVCYVGEQPNRNKTIITKEVATEMAQSLPGAMIVGYFNEATDDFEGHNKVIDISNGKFEISDITKPYGFVDLNAKVWFEKFLDDGKNEHEYLMTEGYLWTGQFPECERIITKGNGQSMELSEKNTSGSWTKDDNGKPEFFIINEAIISKLCILGEEVEPCFEGAAIGKVQFSLDDDFKNTLFSMMNEIKDLLKKEGEAKMYTTYAVEIGDNLWSLLYNYLHQQYPDGDSCSCSLYSIFGIYEEGTQKYAILRKRIDATYHRLDFVYDDEHGFVPAETLTEVTMTFVPSETPQFDPEKVQAFEAEYAKKAAEKEEEKEEDQEKDEPEEEVCPECGKKLDECTCNKKKYNLEEIEEYVALEKTYAELQNQYSALETEINSLKEELDNLREFKASIETAQKQEMIDKFYMLSDEEKQDVITNIEQYSLDEIEAKLSVICVRNKVGFDLDENTLNNQPQMTYNLDASPIEDVPEWVKAVQETEKNKNL